MEKSRYILRKTPFLILIYGFTAVAADLIYILYYTCSLPPDVLSASADRIYAMLEYMFASLTVLIGGTLLFDYTIKSGEKD